MTARRDLPPRKPPPSKAADAPAAHSANGVTPSPLRDPFSRTVDSVPLMRAIMVLILFSALGGVSCGGGAEPGDERRSVVASFYPLAFAAEQIGGSTVEVTNLTPPGAEPHDVELSVRDVERVRSADVVLYLGSGFQPALERAVEGARGETIDLLQSDGGEPGANPDEGRDPHVWLDPVRYAYQARLIGEALGRTDAANRFGARLTTLDAEFERGLARCARRQIVTSHAAFGYLADRYRLEQVALTGLAPGTEPTARDLERLVRDVERSGATTVFFETLVSPRLAQTVAREAGVETEVLNPLEGLTDAERERGADYVSIMRENLEALRGALGCR